MLKGLFAKAAALMIVLCSNCAADATERSYVEAAAPGSPYDFVVHVPNSYDYGYNPLVRTDRFRSARQAVKSFCPRSQVLGDEIVTTEIWGLTSSPPQYVVYVICKARHSGR